MIRDGKFNPVILIIFLIMALIPLTLHADESDIGDPEMQKALASRLTIEKKKLEDAISSEKSMLAELFHIESEYQAKERNLARLRNNHSTLIAKLKTSREEVDRLSNEATQRQDRLSRRLKILYKAGRGVFLKQILASDNIYTLIERYRELVTVLKQDLKLAAACRADAALLKAKRLEMLGDREKIDALLQEEKGRALEVEIERQKRIMLLMRIQQDKTLSMKATRELEEATRKSQNWLQDFTSKPPSPPKQQPERPLVLDFEKRKGYLPMPVVGPVIMGFGRNVHAALGTITFSSGIDIQAQAGAQVIAVADGRVCYVGDLMGYGRVLILDHGNRYHTLYGHLDRIFAVQDDLATQGTPLATIGSTGSITGPKLHFEIRHMGHAVDPMPWLATGR